MCHVEKERAKLEQNRNVFGLVRSQPLSLNNYRKEGESSRRRKPGQQERV